MEFPSYPDDWFEIIKVIKRRDNFTCKKCLTKYPANSKWLRVHHIISISKWIKNGYKGNPHTGKNLITRCYKCHGEDHPHLKVGSCRTIKKKRRSSFTYDSNRKSGFGYKRGF